MRNTLLLLIAILSSIICCGQKKPLAKANQGKLTDITVITKQNRLENLSYLTKHKLISQGKILSGASLLNPKKLSAFIKQQSRGITMNSVQPFMPSQAPDHLSTSSQIKKAGTLSCNNNSFFKIAGLTKSVVYVTAITHTADDGVLIAGVLYDSTVLHSDWRINAYLLKSDNLGNILWAELLVDQNPNDQYYYFNPLTIREMQGGDIMMAAYIDTSSDGNERPATSIYHLSATGAIMWHTELKSSMLQYENEWVYFQVKDINPGLNGDYIVSGTSVAVNYGAQGETVVRLDANGKYIWDANLTNKTGDYNFGAEGLNAFVYGNNIVAIGYSHGSSLALTAATIFTILDYGSGTVQSNRFFVNNDQSTLASFKNFSYYTDAAVQLANGHYLLYDVLLSAYLDNPDTTYYFGVEEYDAGFNPVNSYTINSLVSTPYGNTFFYMDKNSNGYFSFPIPINSSTNNLYFSTLHNNQIAHQRVITFPNNISTGFSEQACFMNDGACYLVDDYYDPNSGCYFSMKKMYDSDTPSICIGQDTLFAFPEPLMLVEDPGYYYLDSPKNGEVQPLSYLIGTGGITDYALNACQQTSACQTLQINGQHAICGANQTFLYTAHRNRACGAIPIWNIDTAVTSSITLIDDTTISVTFKNTNWNGNLYASLAAEGCQPVIVDSLYLTIVSAPLPPSLVADTTLCPGNSIILKPGPLFASYTWQDGFQDSNYVVKSPGVYTLIVVDHCGNKYTSSTQVASAQFSFNAGPDTIKCNGDSITLKATGGFTNYQWSASDFQDSGLQDSVVIVNPGVTTVYTVTADKWQGCTMQASEKVTVYHSPVIHLGDDTSFCSGGSLLLDAGSGFANYAWNTGQSTEEITASVTGTYSVLASTTEGCQSQDSIQVLLLAIPVFSLGGAADTTICSNAVLLYSFPANGDAYLWSDSFSSPVRSIYLAGNYSLTVTNQAGCSTTHSIEVNVQPIPVPELGTDTALCDGQTLLLNAANNNSTYLWQDGSTSSTYSVTNAGTYSVKVTDNGCDTSAKITVTYISKPIINLISDTTLCVAQQIVLDASYPNSTYEWQDGSTNSQYTVIQEGNYAVKVTNNCGTTIDSSIVKYENCACKFYVPNAFTPNGDGKNDIFVPKYQCVYSNYEMKIYNRWGQIVFVSENPSNGWDGTVSGTPQPIGAYVWESHTDQIILVY